MARADRIWWRRYDSYLNSQGSELTCEGLLAARWLSLLPLRLGRFTLQSAASRSSHIMKITTVPGARRRRSPNALPPLPRNYYRAKIPPSRLHPLAMAMVVALQAKGRAGLLAWLAWQNRYALVPVNQLRPVSTVTPGARAAR